MIQCLLRKVVPLSKSIVLKRINIGKVPSKHFLIISLKQKNVPNPLLPQQAVFQSCIHWTSISCSALCLVQGGRKKMKHKQTKTNLVLNGIERGTIY